MTEIENAILTALEGLEDERRTAEMTMREILRTLSRRLAQLEVRDQKRQESMNECLTVAEQLTASFAALEESVRAIESENDDLMQSVNANAEALTRLTASLAGLMQSGSRR